MDSSADSAESKTLSSKFEASKTHVELTYDELSVANVSASADSAESKTLSSKFEASKTHVELTYDELSVANVSASLIT